MTHSPSSAAPRWRLAIGLGIPFCAVDLALPLLDRIPGTILGFPVVTFWLYGWFVLTTICMALVWLLHDRYIDDRD